MKLETDKKQEAWQRDVKKKKESSKQSILNVLVKDFTE